MNSRTSITKQDKKRKLKDGSEVILTRYILNYKHPATGNRAMKFFKTRKEAEACQRKMIVDMEHGVFCDERSVPTVKDIVAHWLNNRQGEIREHTFKQYQLLGEYITGPVLIGTMKEKSAYRTNGKKPADAKFLPMLAAVKVTDLTTGTIRQRFNALAEVTTMGMAKRALQCLGFALQLAEEDFNIRTPKLPRNFATRRQKQKKRILTLEQVNHLLCETRKDEKWGLYVAWPFYTGTRISEQLGLLWEDIDFANSQIHIRHTQGRDGSIEDVTKTDAGNRIIPMCNELKRWLLEWQETCPRNLGELHRVFPAQGFIKYRPVKQLVRAGGPLLVANFRNRVWTPTLKRLELPHITPHSARHMVISAMQAQGIEVGLVSKIVGHSNPSVTIQHYTHPMRQAGDAMEKLALAYQGQ